MQFKGTTYTMRNIHFHAGSEHFVDGKQSALEMHMVHSSDAGQLLVIGFLVDVGKSDPFLVQFLKTPLTDEPDATAPINNVDFSTLANAVDASQFWTYQGSLTTPPCTEGVTFVISQSNLQLSSADIEMFKKYNFHPYSNRPIQRPKQPKQVGVVSSGINLAANVLLVFFSLALL
jgi:carbonic anhydrase